MQGPHKAVLGPEGDSNGLCLSCPAWVCHHHAHLEVQDEALALAGLAEYIHTGLLHLWDHGEGLNGGEAVRFEAACQGARHQLRLKAWLACR